MTWSSTDAQSCSASGAWSGAKSLAGSEHAGPITTQSVFVLACSGAGGTISRSVTVDVLPAANQPPQFLGAPFNLQAVHGITTRRAGLFKSGSSDVAMAPDGKVVVAGWGIDDAASGARDLVVDRYESNGIPDATFGSNGRMVIPVAPALGSVARIAVQTDGKILVAGTVTDADALVFGDLFFLARINADGTMDSSFGSGNGWVVTDLTPNDDYARAIALQADGKILVAGHLNVGGDCCGYYGIVRYTETGALDASFGGQGGWPPGVSVYVIGEFGGGAKDLLVQPDGKILVAGEASYFDGGGIVTDIAVLRLNQDGAPDVSFGSAGVALTYGCERRDGAFLCGATNKLGGVALLPDGRIVVASSTADWDNASLFLLNVQRLLADGSEDDSLPFWTSFNLSNDDRALDVALQADGRILVVGSSDTGSGTEQFVLRLLADGTPDSSYGDGGGMTDLPFTDAQSSEARIVIQPDGMSVLVGSSEAGITVARYHSAGGLDTTFGQGNVLLAGAPIAFAYPGDQFSDPDGDPLSYAATSADGSPLPAWLSFDPGTRLFSGTPPAAVRGLSVSVTASDPGGLTASETFGLLVLAD